MPFDSTMSNQVKSNEMQRTFQNNSVGSTEVCLTSCEQIVFRFELEMQQFWIALHSIRNFSMNISDSDREKKYWINIFLLLRHHRPTKCLMNMALPHFALIKTFSGEQTLFANENAKFEMLYLQSNIVGGWKVCFKHFSCCVHSCLQKRLKQTFRPIKSWLSNMIIIFRPQYYSQSTGLSSLIILQVDWNHRHN